MKKLTRLLFGDQRDPRQVLAVEFGTPVPTSGSVPPEALQWARQTLNAAQIDATQQPLDAIRLIRRKKNFGVKTTKYLIDHLS